MTSISDLVSPFVLAISAFCLSAAATPLVRRFARSHGFVAQPRPDRWHKRPTALLGGVAVYVAIVTPLLFSAASGGKLLILAAGLTGIFVLGLVDDLLKLTPYQKLVGQVAVAGLVSAGGITFEGVPLPLFAVPLTVFWLVAITNAFNLLDNMDGLSAGIACVSGTALLAMGLLSGNDGVAAGGAIVAGATLGFLLYNSSPASIFMGDSGSMVLGLAVGGLSVLGNGYGAPQNLVLTVVVPIAVLGVPLFDTALVSVMRSLNGRAISQGGRDHTSHRLVALGLTEQRTVWVLYAISAVFGAFALSTRFVDVLVSLVLLTLLVVGLVLFGTYLAQVKVYTDAEVVGLRGEGRAITVLGGSLMYKTRMAEVSLDLVLIFVAYLGAYLLKFEGTLTGPFLAQFSQSIPIVIVVKLVAFLLTGIYGGVWKYVGLPEVVALAKASIAGSLLCVVAVALIWGFEGYSRSVFVIDWLLLTWLLAASRMSFRLLAHMVQSIGGAKRKRILIVGEEVWAVDVLRTLQQHYSGKFMPVGLVLEGENGQDMRVHGVPVLGTTTDIGNILSQSNIDGVVIALPDNAADRITAVATECVAKGIPCQKAMQLDLSWADQKDENIQPVRIAST